MEIIRAGKKGREIKKRRSQEAIRSEGRRGGGGKWKKYKGRKSQDIGSRE